jgi:predicted nucleic acid-binding protein
MIVADTNLIAYLYLESPNSHQAERALLKDAHWAAPLLWRSEFRNVLALYIRKRWLSLDETRRIMNEALGLMEEQEYEVDSQQVLRLVASSTCSAYDCEFVALAQDLGVRLVTQDRQLLNDFPDVAVSLEGFINSAQ